MPAYTKGSTRKTVPAAPWALLATLTVRHPRRTPPSGRRCTGRPPHTTKSAGKTLCTKGSARKTAPTAFPPALLASLVPSLSRSRGHRRQCVGEVRQTERACLVRGPRVQLRQRRRAGRPTKVSVPTLSVGRFTPTPMREGEVHRAEHTRWSAGTITSTNARGSSA